MTNNNTPVNKKENPWISLLVSIVIPALILSKFSSPEYLGVVPGFLIALAFPLGWALYNLIVRKQTGFIAIVGLISIFCTGIIGVFEFPSKWIAVKEALVPLLIGLAVVISLKTPYPLVKKLIYNEELLDINRIENCLKEQNNEEAFARCLRISTYLVAASFLLSSILNYLLAKILVTSPAGTEAFNQELGKLTALSYPVIALPSTLVMVIALWYLFKQLSKLTQLEFNELVSDKFKEKNPQL